MKKIIIKTNLSNKLEKVINWLYKDKSLLGNLHAIGVVIFICFLVRLALVGFQQKVYSGYFEYIVILILMFILIFQTQFEFSGWGFIAMFFIGIEIVLFFVFDTFLFISLFGEIIAVLALGHCIYNIVRLVINNIQLHKQNKKSK